MFHVLEELTLLAADCGYDVVECVYKEKEITNVKRQLTMERRWIQCKLSKR
jgi:hypothetical protein